MFRRWKGLRRHGSREKQETNDHAQLDATNAERPAPAAPAGITGQGVRRDNARVREDIIRGLGLGAAVLYGSLIVWIYARQPETFAQVRGGVAAGIGAYRVDQRAFNEGVAHFHAERFEDARAALRLADPAERDPLAQFYIGYSYYRQGWHRLYSDDALFAEGLEAADKAIALDPGSTVKVDDVRLHLRTPRELRAELDAGLRRDASDFNPMRLFNGRK